MTKNKNSNPFEIDATRVDLGEDLLENKAPPFQEKKIEEFEEQEELVRCEILIRENFYEDAKKSLRKILIQNPDASKAKSMLEQIQKIEIQELLSSSDTRKKFDDVKESESKTQIIENLEKDLHLNLERGELKLIPNLFKNADSLDSYKKAVMKVVLKCSPHERVDIGIAHLEMGLNEVAQSIFESVVRYEDFKLSGTYLLAQALISSGKAIEAILKIEPVVRDLTLSEEQKTDFLYLMGYAFEAMSDKIKAREFYRRVYILNPKYRDVSEKLKA